MSPTSCELILKVRMKPLPTPETNPVAKKRKARIIKQAEYLWIDETAITTASESVKEKKKKMGDSTQK